MAGENVPYIYLGKMLARIRSRMQETLSEVSGAVEIDNDTLKMYESGEKRPTEDILDLLISHFSVKDEEASKLWKLAGYEENRNDDQDDMQVIQQPVVILPLDARIIYSDSLNVVINKSGVVLNFMQNGLPGQQAPAARVGMSIEQAKMVAETLAATIKAATEPKSQKNLPSPKKDDKK